MDPLSVTLWLLGTAVVPDAWTRIVDVATQKDSYHELTKAVREDTGIKPGRPYRRWVQSEATWRGLVARNRAAYDDLVDSLASEQARGLIRTRPLDRPRAEMLVNSTIDYFLSTLDPAAAVAVVDARAEERHEAVMERLDAHDGFDANLGLIPASAREVLLGENVPRPLAERLVGGIVAGNPAAVIRGWCAVEPDWLATAPAMILLALGHLAQCYGLRAEAGQFYERVAGFGIDAPRWYACAALEAEAVADAGRRDQLMANATATGGGPFVELVYAVFRNDWPAIASIVDDETATDPLTAALFATALHLQGNRDGAIKYLSRAVEEHPERPHLALALARLLLGRSTESDATSRDLDRERAEALALRARDLRRSWRVDSGEAVVVAQRAAFAAGDNDTVLRLGTLPPDGEALPVEAATPEVLLSVSEVSVLRGDSDAAQLAASGVSGFLGELIRANVLAISSTDRDEVREQYEQAWALATSEDDKVMVWLTASTSGVEPLPGADELEARTDDLPVLCTAAQHIANERFDQAIHLLRPMRENEHALRLLTNAYVGKGDDNAAVADLDDAARRFANVDHLIRATKLLVGRDRIEEAASFADRALLLVPDRHPERGFLFEVGVAAANNRSDWPEMEARARAWITAAGPNRRRRWSLCVAIFNQNDHERAWQVLTEEGPVQPERIGEAQLWIALHAKFAPSQQTLTDILGVVELFPDDPDVRASAVNAFLLMASDEIDIQADELGRWHALIDARAANPGAGDSFQAVTIPDDPAEFVEVFRPLLENQAQQVEVFVQNVRRDNWPYGILAIVASGAYTKILAQRAVGYLPVSSPDAAVVKLELDAVHTALADGHVVTDNSVAVVGWYLVDLWPKLLGAFRRVEATTESRDDAAKAAEQMRPRSSETLGWDIEEGRPVLHTTDEESLDRLTEQLDWVRHQVAGLAILPPPVPPTGGEEPPDFAWMTALDAARTTGKALWADDAGLRALARSEGVPAFGTDVLLVALSEVERISPDEFAGAIEVLKENYCVDFKTDRAWLIRTAARDQWLGGPALLVLTRPGTWAEPQYGFEVWRDIAIAAAADDLTKVARWVEAAITGVAGAMPAVEIALPLAAGLLVRTAALIEFDPECFVQCAMAARRAMAYAGLPDPLELALESLLELLTAQVGVTLAASGVARAASELTLQEHVDARRRVLLDLGR